MEGGFARRSCLSVAGAFDSTDHVPGRGHSTKARLKAQCTMRARRRLVVCACIGEFSRPPYGFFWARTSFFDVSPKLALAIRSYRYPMARLGLAFSWNRSTEPDQLVFEGA